jgi:hypothetical protein
MHKYIRIALLGILIFASVLRLFNLSNVPAGVSVDEAAAWYNSYSILKTGADEYGQKFPIIFRSFDDYKPGLFFYLAVPFVAIFNLQILAVRLPSVLMGIVAVGATYFLVTELIHLFGNNKPLWKSKTTLHLQFQAEHVGLTAALLLAISPWHIYLSRIGFEINTGITFLILAMLFLIKKRFIFSSLFFAFSYMTYQAEKIIIPVLLFGILIIFHKAIWNRKRQLIVPIIIFGFFTIPFTIQSLQPQALTRFKGTNIYSGYQELFMERSVKLMEAKTKHEILKELLYNRRVLAVEIALKQYISHFNPKWLFLNSGSEPHKMPGLGLLWIWELPIILVGIVMFLRSNLNYRAKLLILLWFLSSPIAASITTGAPHATRSYSFIPTWQIFGGFGIIYISDILLKSRKIAYLILLFCISFSTVVLYKNYFVRFPHEQSDSFQYPLSNVMQYVLKNENKYDKIIISNSENTYQSYMYYLYISKYDPKKYQESGGTISGGFAEKHAIGKYEFRPIDWRTESDMEKYLYIVNNSEASDKLLTLYKGYNKKEEVKIIVQSNHE